MYGGWDDFNGEIFFGIDYGKTMENHKVIRENKVGNLVTVRGVVMLMGVLACVVEDDGYGMDAMTSDGVVIDTDGNFIFYGSKDNFRTLKDVYLCVKLHIYNKEIWGNFIRHLDIEASNKIEYLYVEVPLIGISRYFSPYLYQFNDKIVEKKSGEKFTIKSITYKDRETHPRAMPHTYGLRFAVHPDNRMMRGRSILKSELEKDYDFD